MIPVPKRSTCGLTHIRILILTILVFFNFLLSAEPETTNNTTPSITVKILPQKIHYSKLILGLNGNLSNAPYLFNYPEVIKRYRECGAQYIRFPGGTIANLYNWKTGLRVGFKGISEKLAQNVRWSEIRARRFGIYYKLDYFLDFLSKTKTNFSIVLNIFSISPRENASMLKYIKNKGFTVKYVEIGNEIYNRTYKSVYPTAKSYADKAKIYAKEVKAVFPNAKIGLAIPPTAYRYNLQGNISELKKWQRKYIAKSIEWYRKLKTYKFYDAVIIHMYNSIKWNKEKTIQDFYIEALTRSDDRVFKRTFKTIKFYFPHKEIWVTEWNSGLKQWLSEKYESTYAKALYAADFIRKLLLERQVTIAGLHNFPNLFHPRYLKETKNRLFPTNKHFKPTPKFYTFKLLKEAILNSKYVFPVSISGGKYFNAKPKSNKTKLSELTGIYFSGGLHPYMLIINRWRHRYILINYKHAQIIKTLISKNLSSTNVTFKTQKIRHNTIEIPPYSINLIR